MTIAPKTCSNRHVFGIIIKVWCTKKWTTHQVKLKGLNKSVRASNRERSWQKIIQDPQPSQRKDVNPLNLKQWTTAITLCAVTLVASTTGVAPALAADDTAAVETTTMNLEAAAQALNAATQQLNNGNTNGTTNTSGSINQQTTQKPSNDTASLGYDYITLTDAATTIDGQVYLPLRSTFAAMKAAALEVEWKPENQQKIKLIGTDEVFELYLTNGDTAIQLQQGGQTYPIKSVNSTLYVPMSFFQAIAQTANIELSGNNLLVLKDKAGTSVWDSGKQFWYNMNYYQHATTQQQPSVDVTVPDVNVTVPDTQQPQQPSTKPETTPSVPDINVPNNTIGGQIVNNALQYLGVPYVWGGSTPEGFDCSGLVQYVYAQCGISVPRVSYDQQAAATPISLVALQPGDLVFWGDSAYHVGIYIGDGMYIHAPAPGQNVKIQSYSEYPYTSAGRIFV